MDLTKHKVVELRAKLSEAGLDTSGLKAELVDRLTMHLESQQRDCAKIVSPSKSSTSPRKRENGAKESHTVTATTDVETINRKCVTTASEGEIGIVLCNADNDGDDDDCDGNDDNIIHKKEGKNRRRRRKKKHNAPVVENGIVNGKKNEIRDVMTGVDVEIEYVPDTADLSGDMAVFAGVFERFREYDDEEGEDKKEDIAGTNESASNGIQDDEGSNSEGEDGGTKLSKTQLKKKNRLSVAELKQLVLRPDVVEMWDVTAADPRLLVHLKGYRNTVPVPRHWCMKRKYLQNKRGLEKPPFALPAFIRDTGVTEMREALSEKEKEQGLKAKQRERVRPKMGKMEIDYQKLHDAFFRWQTKPRMSIHGDLYYEGKEYESKQPNTRKPGELSAELRISLGMVTGPGEDLVPPPWLIAMQRYGPPPSYPNLKIPGLNAPIPLGASFGYHPGGWGKPPVDEYGRPLYGDVFATATATDVGAVAERDRELNLSRPWGAPDSEEELSDEESDNDDDDDDDDGDDDGNENRGNDDDVAAEDGAPPSDEVADTSGLDTPATSGLITPMGLETPDIVQLRKIKAIEGLMESGGQRSLYTVIPEKPTSGGIGGNIINTSHTYDIVTGRNTKAGETVSLDPEQLDNIKDQDMLRRQLDSARPEREVDLAKEDLTAMVAANNAQQNKKRKKPEQHTSGRPTKKQKEFKF